MMQKLLLLLRSIPRKAEKVLHFYRLTRYTPSATPAPPTHIEVEATKRCNASCGTCTRSYLDHDSMKHDLQPSTMQKILQSMPQVTSLRLAGLGEIFLNPHIENILQQLKARAIRVWIISNGSLLQDVEVRNLIHNYVHDVAISIDSTDPDEFARLRPMGKIGLDEVLQGTELLIRERNAGRSNTIIGISTTVTRENYRQLPAICNLAVKLGVDYVAVAFVENWMVRGDPGFQETTDLVHDSVREADVICKAIRQSQWRLALHGIAVGYKVPHRRIGQCYWPYKSMHITAEGMATPCCTRIRQNHALFNFLDTKDFISHWHGTEYQALRLAHQQKDHLHPLCGDCPL